ncbi:MAG: acetyl-CoA carboxylase carboxyltransferase subunit alpha [candidate division WOR-3 bacterium]
MLEGWLDFERPIAELEAKIQELSSLGSYQDEISRLRGQVERLKKKIYSNLTPWQKVQLARHPRRPYTLDYIDLICEEFIELHGDRRFADDPAIVAGLAKIDEKKLVIIGHQKGRDTKEKLRRNFGMPHPEGYRKALRVMELAGKFSLPLVTFVDTPGAYPGVGAEERGQAEAIARNLRELATLPVPIVVVISGEGGSGGALAIAIGDRILIMEYATYSVITPEGCASILWRDGNKAEEAAKVLRMTSQDLLEFKVIDEIIPEPLGGAHQDWASAAQNVKAAILKNLSLLEAIPTEELIARRIEKFARLGQIGQSSN